MSKIIATITTTTANIAPPIISLLGPLGGVVILLVYKIFLLAPKVR
jgi:hypothetical protein